MANREACELYIEQEIKDQLAQGKKPWSIGKELSKWVEKLFEVTINPNTLRMRAERIADKDCTNVQKKSNTATESNTYQPLHTPNKPDLTSVTHPPTDRGGAREGAGRPKLIPPSHAMEFASMAISQLDRIQADDPKKEEAFDQVLEYIWTRKENDK